MRPKSMATVVVVLAPPGGRSSRPSLASVIHASVLMGGTSETEPTNVVLPTPNPPATTIFAEIVSARPGWPAAEPDAVREFMGHLEALEHAAAAYSRSVGRRRRRLHGQFAQPA